MSDEQFPKDGDPESAADGMSGDSGLGNLPPLSDFDSRSGLSSSDAGLPPLSMPDSDSDQGGLPPISDIDVETPQPTGGAVHSTPPGFESGPAGFDSGQQPGTASSGAGFQDLAADSDFSPETPDIGPGPGVADSAGVDTPMFDSAFGGGGGAAGFDQDMQTPTPTQAMETPMFGGGAPAAAGGFEPSSFGSDMDFTAGGAGTPAPDFSPDTGMTPAGPVTVEGPLPKPKGSPLKMALLAAVMLLVGAAVGLGAAPYLSDSLSFLPNPLKVPLEKSQQEVLTLKKRVEDIGGIKQGGISDEERIRLEGDVARLTEDVSTTTTQLDDVTEKYQTKQADLEQVNQDIAELNEDYVTAQEMYEDLENETAIIGARQKGLYAEVARLTAVVGELEESNTRRAATLESLQHSTERLAIEIKEGCPLTPEKYSRVERLTAVEELQNKINQAKWVTPALMNSYADLYVKELEIAASQQYFYAKVPVTDAFANITYKWSECLMKGNHVVLYRSLDGKNIGEYRDLGNSAAPMWRFKEDLPSRMRKAIEDEIVASRVPDYREKVKVLARKQQSLEKGTALQRSFDSL